MDFYSILICLFILTITVILINRRSKTPIGEIDIKSENQELKQTVNELNISLARSIERAENLTNEKNNLVHNFNEEKRSFQEEIKLEREKNEELSKSLERSRAYFNAQQEKMKEQRSEIDTIKAQFNKDFELIANKILEEKTHKFTESNLKSLDQILLPFKENIKAFEEKVEKVYNTESAERNILKGVIHTLVEQSKQIQEEAGNLTRALKGDNKKQGNWGEIILERVLERSGLVKNSEYRLQASYVNKEGQRLQPDVIIDLPDDKNLVIDAKVSLLAYERWVNAETEEDKAAFSKQHLESVRSHILGLSAKNYCDLYQINSPDFVLLFIPLESSFSMSVALDSEIFNFAWDKRVVLVSPSTLLATLRTIAGLWKQERQNKNVLEIAREAGLLYDKFVGFIEDFEKIDKQISALAHTHDEARKKLDSGKGNVLSKIQKLKKLGAKTSKQLDSKFIDEEDNSS